jgi:hypothetical protein
MNDIGEKWKKKPFDFDQGFKLGRGSIYRNDEIVIYPLGQKQHYVDLTFKCYSF